MPDGYTGRKDVPDVGWWMDQIRAGEDFRKDFAREAQWDKWRKYYRGRWANHVLPVNIFFSYLRASVPRIYFRNPAVSVTPSKPGLLEMSFAQVVNRLDNKLIRQMDLKGEGKAMVQDTFLFGTSFGKYGYGGQFTPAPPEGGEVKAPSTRKGYKVEYDPTVRTNTPWFKRTRTGNMVVPIGTTSWRDARWIATYEERAVEDVKEDSRFGADARGGVRAAKQRGVNSASPIEMAALWEIRDRKTGKVFVLSPFSDESKGGRVLLDEEDTLTDGEDFPIWPLIFNPDDEVFWGIPDSQILEPYQLELNEIRTLQMKHRRMAIAKLLVKRGAMTEDQMSSLLSEDVAAVVEIDSPGNPESVISKMQVANVPQDLLIGAQETMQDVRESLGFSRNQLGEFQNRRGDTSAAEAKIVERNSETRIDERRDAIADVIVKMVRKMNSTIFKRWTGRDVVDIVGPGGAKIWVKFDPAMLQFSQFGVKVDPDSAQPQVRRAREAKAMQVYQVLKENPLIDPDKLTRFLLTELEGVEMDDLMRALPAPENVPNQPIGVEALPGLISRQVGRARGGAGGVTPPPRLLRGGR